MIHTRWLGGLWLAVSLIVPFSLGCSEAATMDQDVSSLMTALGSPQETARAEAAEKLSLLDPEKVRAAALVLVEACGDESEAVREAAVGALEEMGPPDPEVLDGLTALLANTNADVAYWAATLIGRLGPDGAASVSALIATMEESPHQNVRQRVARVLGKIGPGAARAKDPLQKAVAGDDPRLARLAERALGEIER
jgi:HEAT repeat protein